MFAKTETAAPAKPAALLTASEATVLARSQDYLQRIATNERTAQNVAADIARHTTEVDSLRRQRGGAADPSVLSRQINRLQNELDVLRDRADFLERERIELRQGVTDGLGAVRRAHASATERAGAAFRAELLAAIETCLAPLLSKGRALGIVGDAASSAAVEQINIPDPANPNAPLVRAGQPAFANYDLPLSSEAAAIVDALGPLNEVHRSLSRLESAARNDSHRAQQAKMTEAFKSRPQPKLGGLEPPPDPERERGNRLFPKTEITGGTMYPDDPARLQISHGHMNDPNALRFEEMEHGEIGK